MKCPRSGQSSDLYEVILERHRRASTIVTSNRAIEEWIPLFDDPILAQSALDRLAHNAYQVVIEGESFRKRQRPGERGATPAPRASRRSRRTVTASEQRWHGPDVVAALERRAVQRLAGYAGFLVTRGDARLLSAEVGKQIVEAIMVGVLEVRAVTMGQRGSSGTEGQRGHIHVGH